MPFGKRLDALERVFARSFAGEGPCRGLDPDLAAIYDELSRLRSSQAVHYRGGVRIEPENLPEKLLGPGYTHAELRELAVARGLERRGYSTQEIAELIPVWLERFEHFDRLRAEKTRRPTGGGRLKP